MHDTDPDDRLARLTYSQQLLRSRLWPGKNANLVLKVWTVAAFKAAGSPAGRVQLHARDIAEAVDLRDATTGRLRTDRVRETLRLLAEHDVLDWEQGQNSSDLAWLALPLLPQPEPEDDDDEDPAALAAAIIARQHDRLARQEADALRMFDNGPTSAESDRDPRRG